jgi:hypothetical protein
MTWKNIMTLLLMLTIGISYGQKEASIWYFGSYAGLDFTCSTPVPIRSGMYYTQEACASISDEDGHILFYTNGDTVYNSVHEVMPNGFGIGNDPSCWGSTTQGALIIPQPGSDSLYYIFTIDCADDDSTLPNAFRYSLVDMSLNDGLGDVVVKRQHIQTPVTEKLAAMQHANGTDFWVVTHEHGTDVFNTYLVDSTGFDTVPVVSHAGQVQWLDTYPEAMTRGYMKFSPNGERLVVLSVSDQHIYCLYPELFHFNDSTGEITLDYTIVDPDSVNYYGASFSPDNNLLYLSGGWYGKYVHQFDANAGSSEAFLASKEIIYTTTVHNPSTLQLGLDGKIYVATNRWWIDVIEYPNLPGDACTYQEEEIMLSDCPSLTFSIFGLPNYPEHYFRSIISGSNCEESIVAQFLFSDACADSLTQFNNNSVIFPDTINYWSWDFGDPSSGSDNVSNLENPTHTYTSPGTYTVMLIVAADYDGIICKTDTISMEVVIDECEFTPIDETAPDIAKIYPNPFSDLLTVSSVDHQQVTLFLYDFLGQQIFQETIIHSTTINTTQLAEGIYFYELRNLNGNVASGQLVKY